MAKVSKNASTNWTRDISKRSQDWLKTSSRLVPYFWVPYFRDSGCHQHLGNLSIDPIHSMYSECCCSRDTIESWSRDILELGFTQVLVLVLVLKAKIMNLWVLTTTLCLRPNPTYMLSLGLHYMVHTNQYRGRPIYSSSVCVITMTVTIQTATVFMVRIRIDWMTCMLSSLVKMMSVRKVTVR